MIREPLWDLAGRTVSVGSDVGTTIEALLRLQNTADRQRPVTLYLIGSPSAALLPTTDALLLCSLIRTLQSPVETIAMGIISQPLPLILAAGTRRRCLLKHAMVSLSPFKWDAWPAARAPIGLAHPPSPPPRTLLDQQLSKLMRELDLDPELFATERLLTAEEAVEHRLADMVVAHTPPQLQPNPEPPHEAQR